MSKHRDLYHPSTLAVIGIACRLPGAKDVEAYWDLICRGKYAIDEVPESRFDRKSFYDKKKGVKGKSYMKHAGLIDYTAFDPRECRLPDRLIGMCDVGSLEMCRVAAAACRDAGINPFQVPYPQTGVYLGSTVSGCLRSELLYRMMCPELARLLEEIPSLQPLRDDGTVDSGLLEEVVRTVRGQGPLWPKKGFAFPTVHSISLAVSESLGLSGPSVLLDAACSSSLNALAMAKRDLSAGRIDMAIVGGGVYFTPDNLLLFSNAQSGSPDGSFPFGSRANGLIQAEGYTALIVKQLSRAREDGDRIHALVHGIGLSSDGKGRSHWAPKVEGQVEAMCRAYADPADRRRLAYLEAHATSTPVGDRTEMEALQNVFSGAFDEKRPIGSVKGNIGHALETAGTAGLIKSILVLKHGTIPPQGGSFPLNPEIDWDNLPFYVPEKAGVLPASKDGRPRLAAVSAFGVGGINAHVVIEEPTALAPEKTRVAVPGFAPAAPSVKRNENRPIAVIGAGAVFPGARTLRAFEALVFSETDPKIAVPAERWDEKTYGKDAGDPDPWKTTIRRGGFITDFRYDWKRHRIPPKQIETGNPLQYMILDAVDAALDDAGYGLEALKSIDRLRTGVVVGSTLATDFLAGLTLSFRGIPFRDQVLELLRRRGVADPEILRRIGQEFLELLYRRITTLSDETGGFTASSLASRITKAYDLMGGCATVDAGSVSAMTALAQGIGMLRENENDMVLCSAGSRNMLPENFIDRENRGLHGDGDPLPGEGAAVLVLKRYEDARRDGDPIRCVLHGLGTALDADPETAMRKALESAWSDSGLSGRRLSEIPHVELSSAAGKIAREERSVFSAAYPRATYSNPALQIGDTQAVSGFASLLKASAGAKENGESLAAVSAWDSAGIACHLILDRAPVTTVEVKSTSASTGADTIRRLAAPTLAGLREKLVSLVSSSGGGDLDKKRHKNAFDVSDVYRIAFLPGSERSLASQAAMALESIEKEHAPILLARQQIYFGRRESRPGKIAMLFSGQGSQYEGMLRPLLDGSPRPESEEIDEALRSVGAPDFAGLAWSKRPELGTDVLWTQLSLFAADMNLYRIALEAGLRPDVVAGHSYGEFPALTAAGAWTLRQGVRATKIRCEAILACENAQGKLLATPMDESEAEKFCREMSASNTVIYVANANSPSQTVLGGTESAVRKAAAILSERKIGNKILAVPRPFHTPLMEGVRQPLFDALEAVPASKPTTPFFSSVSNRFEEVPARIRRNLADQMAAPVRYVELIRKLLDDGCTALIECGPGAVLTGLHQKIVPPVDPVLCLALDNKGTGGVSGVLAVRAVLEVAGYFDTENTPTVVPSSAQRESSGGDRSKAIRKALRRQADTFVSEKNVKTDQPVPEFIVRLADGAKVRPEPLFAYWKSNPGDEAVFSTDAPPVPLPVHTPVHETKIEELGFDEYVRLLREYPEIPAENLRRRVTRFVPRLVGTPLVKTDGRKYPVAGRILVLGDSPVGEALERKLRENGYEVVRMRVEEDRAALVAGIGKICAAEPTPHLFVLPNREDWEEYRRADDERQTLDAWEPAAWKSCRDRRVLRPFDAIQAWYAELFKDKERFRAGSLCLATFHDGTAGLSGGGDLRGGSSAGLAKNVFLEGGLSTDYSFKSLPIDFSGDMSPEQCADLLLDEWTYGPVTAEVAYRSGRRYVVQNVPDFVRDDTQTTAFTGRRPALPLSESRRPRGTWVVTGGARGVTAYTARTLAARYGLKLHLLGSSPLPDVPVRWLELDEAGKKELQRTVMLRAREEKKNPLAEWARIERSVELLETLRKYDREGVSYTYHVCDVSDAGKLAEVLENIRKTDGPITGILHGAGVDRSASFQKKDPATVETTIAVKADAAAALAYFTQKDPIRHFIAFGSNSGRLGSYGQADYAVANDTLAKIVHAYGLRRPDCHAVCFAWGAWDEIGMAMRPELKNSVALKEFNKMPPGEGVRLIEEEWSFAAAEHAEHEVLVADWKILSNWFASILRSAPKPRPDLPDCERRMKRMLLRMVPIGDVPVENSYEFPGKAVIYGDNPDARALREYLEKRSVPVALLPETEDADAMEKFVRENYAVDPPLHLFLMSCRNPEAQIGLAETDLPDRWDRRRRISFDVPYAFLREWLKILGKKELLGRASVAAAVSLGGSFAVDETARHDGVKTLGLEGALLGGFLKGLHNEHGAANREGMTVRILDAPQAETPENVAAALVDRLGPESQGGRLGIEFSVVDGKILMPRIVDAEFSEEDRKHPQAKPITRGGTWIAVGGARGITAETVKLLAPRYGLKVHLIGTVPKPEIEERLRYLSDGELEPYKKQMVREALKNKQLPDKIWEVFRKDLEIDRNLRRMRELGIEVEYHQCDLLDGEQLAKTVQTIRAKDGPISGVIQGGGFVANGASIRTAAPVHVETGTKMISLKVDATFSLLELLKNDPLEAFVAFGSVSGRFGASGVSSYCAGNEAMCKLMALVRDSHPGCHAVGFHWHAWDEVGMTMRPICFGSVNILKMSLLSPKEGSVRLVEELEYGNDFEVIVTDDQYYSLSYSPEMKVDGKCVDGKGDDGESEVPAGFALADRFAGNRMETVWNPVEEVVIAEHRLADKPILPAAFMVEAIVQAGALLSPKKRDGAIPRLRNFEIAEALRFFNDAPQTMRTEVEPYENGTPGLSCRLLSTFVNAKGIVLNANRFHAGAKSDWLIGDRGLPEEWARWASELRVEPGPIEKHSVRYVPKGSKMYHGPVLQELQWAGIRDDRAWGESFTQPLRNWATGRPRGGWITRPASFDACLYLCGLATWYFSGGSVGLPKSVGELLFVRAPRDGERCRIYVRKTGATDTAIRYDFAQFGEDGTPVCLAKDLYVQLLLGSKTVS